MSTFIFCNYLSGLLLCGCENGHSGKHGVWTQSDGRPPICDCMGLPAGSGSDWLAAYGLFAKDPFDAWKKGSLSFWKGGKLVHHPTCEDALK